MQTRRKAVHVSSMLWPTPNDVQANLKLPGVCIAAKQSNGLLLLVALVDHTSASADAECENTCTFAASSTCSFQCCASMPALWAHLMLNMHGFGFC